ncbi:class I SAM-dependent methyltransferase [Niabella aurantiaca]|uniref:class I SAM-dependent methyltransferase n=1 Tax=Niabella aurantiaca TaxID=379900 RepID=UPI0003698737|nr:methyltransferase domain-containing protein [Niabella aurantiaca]
MSIREARNLIAQLPFSHGAPLRWADLGCGTGTFTHALSGILPANSTIYAFDKSKQVFNAPGIRFFRLDFEKEDLPVPPLSGILMANSLHYVKDPLALIKRLRQQLVPEGLIALVEYNTGISSSWVPFPIPFSKAAQLAAQCGFKHFHLLGTRPSVYHGEGMYAIAFAA